MDKIKHLLRLKRSGKDANAIRIRRRRTMVAQLYRRLPFLTSALLLAGYLWMLIVPSPSLGRGTYIDENALQPGQVNTYWGWGDVHAADRYLGQLEALQDANATSEQRAEYLETEFGRLGLSASTQGYNFTATTGRMRGVNAYAVLSSPRAAGNEAMVISASWLSRTGEGDGTLNLRGVATVLALARYLKQHSLWAKDLVFVVSDGYLDGMHAWLSAYHGSVQSNLDVEHLRISSGVIWTALNIDYPGHSFSHLGIFFEGLNGRLPNQDLLNSFQRISRHTGGVPVVVYDHLDPRDYPEKRDELEYMPTWLPQIVRTNPAVEAYAYQAKNVARHVGYQARGRASGVHGLLHQFRIDAITLFGVPATGPHGFHAIGRVVESTLRTTNNLLERLHASFFFYILTGPDRFLKIGSYLPSAVLVSVAMMFWGLGEWVNAAWMKDPAARLDEKAQVMGSEETWIRRKRPVLEVLCIMICTHILGVNLFTLMNHSWFIENQRMLSPLFFVILSTIPLTALLVKPQQSPTTAPLSLLLKSLNLCFASTVISITTVLNFSLAASLAILLGIPLCLSSSSHNIHIRLTKYIIYVALGLGWLLVAQDEIRKALWNWEILDVWFAPFVCVVYMPLMLQAGIACLLP